MGKLRVEVVVYLYHTESELKERNRGVYKHSTTTGLEIETNQGDPATYHINERRRPAKHVVMNRSEEVFCVLGSLLELF